MLNIANNKNLDLNVLLQTVKKKQNYIHKIEKEILNLNLFYQLNKNYYNLQNCNVAYVICILQSRTDTLLHITNSFGELLFSCNACSVGFKKKAKRKARNSIIKKFVTDIITSDYFSYLKTKPIALHFKNTGSIHQWVIKFLYKKFYIQNVRFFNITPFNGCRAKKIRRKKTRKKRRDGRVV